MTGNKNEKELCDQSGEAGKPGKCGVVPRVVITSTVQ